MHTVHSHTHVYMHTFAYIYSYIYSAIRSCRRAGALTKSNTHTHAHILTLTIPPTLHWLLCPYSMQGSAPHTHIFWLAG